LNELEFAFTANKVDKLIAVGSYSRNVSTNGRLIIALRGCAFSQNKYSAVDQVSIQVRAVRPNHEDFNCLIGSVDLHKRTVSLYTASTVPRRPGMLRYYNKVNFGTKAINCNLLPTGCYEYCVGTHGGKAGPVEYVPRLGDGPTSDDAGQAVVVRTTNDLIYGTMDT
jgi:hypothetical protein